MRILIVGATGVTGQQLVEQALAQDHEVTALARNPATVKTKHARLKIVGGDVLNANSLEVATANQQAVVSAIGTKLSPKPTTLLSEGTKNLIQAMEKHGVRRFVCITGIGAGDSKGHGGFLYDKIILPFLLKNVYKDKDRQEAEIRKSNLDWIIVRPAQLTNGPAKGKYRVLTDLTGLTVGKISRADVAGFVLEQLSSDRYVRKTPLIAY